MKEKSKIVLIGLDGATWDLIKPWTKEGKLPFFKELMEESSYGTLESTVIPMSPPAWTSFLTGKNPGKHGIYDFIIHENGHVKIPNYTSIKTKTLIEILDENNKTFCMFNVPMTYPAPKTKNGLIVSGMPIPEFNSKATYPPQLYKEILEKFGKIPYYPPHYSGGNEKKYIKNNMKINESYFKIMKYIFLQKDYDFFMAVFPEPDFTSHYMWKRMEEKTIHSNNTKEFNPILEVYAHLEKIVKKITEWLDEETYFILASDHGFGRVKKTLHINNFLLEKGYLKLKSGTLTKLKYLALKSGIESTKAFEIATKIGILSSLKRRATENKSFLLKLMKKILLSEKDIDWSRTKAYSMGNIGQIFFNKDIVKTKKEHQKLASELKSKLLELKDGQEKIIENVYEKEEVFWGSELKNAPDLIFHTKNFEYSPRLYFEFGCDKLTCPEKVKTGDHKPNGIFLIRGPNIRKNNRLKTKNITDVAPTVLSILNIKNKYDMDGNIIKEIFN